jgi:hypothetical protein
MEQEIERKNYLLKALQMLVQDLAELIIKNDTGNPRIVKDLHNSNCQKIAKRVLSNTGLGLEARTIRKFKNKETIGSPLSRDIIAATWFVETKVIDKSKVKKDENGRVFGYWDQYMELFRGKKEELSSFLGQQEAVTHEFQEKIASSRDLAMMICAFANKDGGYIFFGVGRNNVELVGVDSNSTLITNTLAALGRFDKNKPKIEFGWGYVLEDDKAFFVIRIYRDSTKTYSANGNKYIKHGAGYRTIDKNERETEVYSYEKATISRSNLIEDIRRIRSILDDHLSYYQIKEKPTSDEEKGIFLLMVLKFIGNSYVTYLSNIWKEVSFKELPPDKSHFFVSVKDDIDYSIKELKKGKLDLFLKKNEIPEIHDIVSQQRDFLIRILGPTPEMTATEVYDAILEVSRAAKQIDIDTNDKFHLTQRQVRI